MKTVIDMSKEAGFTEGEITFMGDNFLRFAELVRAEALAEQPAQQEPLGFMNAGNILEMRQGSLPYAYVYPVKSTGVSVAVYTSPPAQRKPLPPVDGDLLPPVGSQVLIHLASQDQWVAHTVVGYYVWGAFDSDGLHRVFVRVQDSDGILNARSLCDVRAIETAHGIKENT